MKSLRGILNRTAIFIPTYGRAHKLKQVFENIIDSTLLPIKVYFICETEDSKSVETVLKINGAGLILNNHKPCYAGAINSAFEHTNEKIFFVGSDDLNFHKDWLKKAMNKMRNNKKVVGTNDLLSPRVIRGGIATHFLVDREYIQTQGGVIDQVQPVMYEYNHYCCDVEFCETAISRKVFVPCLDSIVEHMHPEAKKADIDATYIKNNSKRLEDKKTFELRRSLWNQ